MSLTQSTAPVASPVVPTAPLSLREQRRGAWHYLQGQLLDLERKTIEPLALALPDGDVQALQQFISQSTWDAEAVLLRHQEIVTATRGDAETGVLIVDGCDVPTHGPASVGVARQWCGALGKVANGQASVVACDASRHGYTLVDRRLYLPETWFTPAYAARRARCGVPPELTFRTKPQVAGEIVATLRARAVLPFRYVTGDEGFGANTVLLDQLAAADLIYLAEVPHTTRVWRAREDAVTAGAGPTVVEVGALAAALPAAAWTRQLIKEGAKGPVEADIARVRARATRDGQPGPDVWVVLRRSLGDAPTLKASLSNASADTPLATLVWLCGMRWPVETGILEAKGNVGKTSMLELLWLLQGPGNPFLTTNLATFRGFQPSPRTPDLLWHVLFHNLVTTEPIVITTIDEEGVRSDLRITLARGAIAPITTAPSNGVANGSTQTTDVNVTIAETLRFEYRSTGNVPNESVASWSVGPGGNQIQINPNEVRPPSAFLSTWQESNTAELADRFT